MTLTPAEARKKNRKAFDMFWNAYPRKIAPTEAERAFSEVVERGCNPEQLITKARAYAASVDPQTLKYVPAPHAWLRQGRYDDADLFSNQIEAEREWFRECWRKANVKAVENRYHVIYEKKYPPEDMKDEEAISLWYRETARAWIFKIYEEMKACRDHQNQHMISLPSSQSSVPSSSIPTPSQTSTG